jgi:hypothetical protein
MWWLLVCHARHRNQHGSKLSSACVKWMLAATRHRIRPCTWRTIDFAKIHATISFGTAIVQQLIVCEAIGSIFIRVFFLYSNYFWSQAAKIHKADRRNRSKHRILNKEEIARCLQNYKNSDETWFIKQHRHLVTLVQSKHRTLIKSRIVEPAWRFLDRAYCSAIIETYTSDALKLDI